MHAAIIKRKLKIHASHAFPFYRYILSYMCRNKPFLANKISLFQPHLPITSNSLQRPLSSVPKVGVLEMISLALFDLLDLTRPVYFAIFAIIKTCQSLQPCEKEPRDFYTGKIKYHGRKFESQKNLLNMIKNNMFNLCIDKKIYIYILW